MGYKQYSPREGEVFYVLSVHIQLNIIVQVLGIWRDREEDGDPLCLLGFHV